ncbi:hypothetical protein [Aurantivibrio plasticivorans]
MNIDALKIEKVKQFVNAITLFGDDSTQRNNIEVYLSHADIYKEIDFLVRNQNFQRGTLEHSIQYDLRSNITFSVKGFLESDFLPARELLDVLFEAIPVIKLINYEVETVIDAHRGYFLPRYEAELIELADSESNNRRIMDPNPYLTYPKLKELAVLLPEVARKVLPSLLSESWGAGYRASAAEQLYNLGGRDQKVCIWKALGGFELKNSILRDREAEKYIIAWIRHWVKARCGSQQFPELNHLERLMKNNVTLSKNSVLANFLEEKWQGSNWSRKRIICENGWEFRFSRAPHIAQCRLRLPGGEVARNLVKPSFPEQLTWLEKILESLSYSAFSIAYVIDYTIHGEDILQALLRHIRDSRILSEEDHLL